MSKGTLILYAVHSNVRLENMKTRYKIGTSILSSILFFQIFFEASLLLYKYVVLCYEYYVLEEIIGKKEKVTFMQ